MTIIDANRFALLAVQERLGVRTVENPGSLSYSSHLILYDATCGASSWYRPESKYRVVDVFYTSRPLYQAQRASDQMWRRIESEVLRVRR